MEAPDLALSVFGAQLVEEDCVFGPRDAASDPEWCHVLDVRVTNEGAVAADLGSDRWRATAGDGAEYTFPAVDGATAVEPDARAEVQVRFPAPAEARLEKLLYADDVSGARAETTIRAYDVA